MLLELIDGHHADLPTVLATTYPFLANLDRYYPDIAAWFSESFAQGLIEGRNRLLLARNSENRIVGVALGKITPKETKLQCVRVVDTHTNTGLGIALMDRMLDVLECEHPVATVSEEMLHQYSRVFVKRYGFSLDDVVKGAYRPRKLEYYFNGASA